MGQPPPPPAEPAAFAGAANRMDYSQEISFHEEDAGDPNSVERSHDSLANTRSFRRRIGEKRISAPIRVIRSFVAALFDAVVGPEPPSWGDAATTTLGMPIEDWMHFISTNRYRLKENLTDDIATVMWEEADLLRDGTLDQDEAVNTAASCGVESRYLRYWCTLLNLFTDPYIQARAMPLRITKRHAMQANSESTEDAVMFKPNLSATQTYKKHAVTTRPLDERSAIKRSAAGISPRAPPPPPTTKRRRAEEEKKRRRRRKEEKSTMRSCCRLAAAGCVGRA